MPENRRESFYFDVVRRFGPDYENFDLATSEVSLSILFTYDTIHQCQSRYMAEYGLSKSSFNVLMLLRHGPPEGMQLHDLGELLLVSRANITGLIDHLQQKGYVTRVVDESDRRARFAKVTAKGQALLDEFVPVHYRNIASLMSSLSAEDKRTLVDLLGKVRRSIHDHAVVCERPVEATQ